MKDMKDYKVFAKNSPDRAKQTINKQLGFPKSQKAVAERENANLFDIDESVDSMGQEIHNYLDFNGVTPDGYNKHQLLGEIESNNDLLLKHGIHHKKGNNLNYPMEDIEQTLNEKTLHIEPFSFIGEFGGKKFTSRIKTKQSMDVSDFVDDTTTTHTNNKIMSTTFNTTYQKDGTILNDVSTIWDRTTNSLVTNYKAQDQVKINISDSKDNSLSEYLVMTMDEMTNIYSDLNPINIDEQDYMGEVIDIKDKIKLKELYIKDDTKDVSKAKVNAVRFQKSVLTDSSIPYLKISISVEIAYNDGDINDTFTGSLDIDRIDFSGKSVIEQFEYLYYCIYGVREYKNNALSDNIVVEKNTSLKLSIDDNTLKDGEKKVIIDDMVKNNEKRTLIGVMYKIFKSSHTLRMGLIKNPTYNMSVNLFSTQEIQNPVGSIITMAANKIPDGYLPCEGATVKRSTYKNLFDVVGETYGAGDGSTTFQLPDFQGMFLRGKGGNSLDFGVKQDDEFKSHDHSMSDSGHHSHTVYHMPGFSEADAYKTYGMPYRRRGGSIPKNYTSAEGSHRHTIDNTGGNETRPVNHAVKYCIKY